MDSTLVCTIVFSSEGGNLCNTLKHPNFSDEETNVPKVYYDLSKIIGSWKSNLSLKIHVPLPYTLLSQHIIVIQKHGGKDKGTDLRDSSGHLLFSPFQHASLLFWLIYISISVLENYPSYITGNISCILLVSGCDMWLGLLSSLSHDFNMTGVTKKKGHIVGHYTFSCWHPKVDLPSVKQTLISYNLKLCMCEN